jgi:hypothetical protein
LAAGCAGDAAPEPDVFTDGDAADFCVNVVSGYVEDEMDTPSLDQQGRIRRFCDGYVNDADSE